MQKPLFVAIVRDGMLVSVHMLNGDPNTTYLLIDEDALEISAMASDSYTDEVIRQRLNDDPEQFLMAVDGAATDPATLYQPHIIR